MGSPGVRRGICPGGESSTPTYVRNTYPNGYVLFANAAIGEIGSTLLGSDGPFPTAPPPPCVDGCSSKPGQHTPECSGQTKARCQQMAQYENKCQWTECPVTMTTTETTLTTTTSSQTTGQCKAWCASNSKSWEKKCRWPKCAGCSACSARRLRGSDIVVL